VVAFCRLNFRYIYTITLRKSGDIDDSQILRFTDGTVTKTLPKLPPEYLVPILIYTLIGLCLLLAEFYRKHFWPHATGVVTACRRRNKSADVLVIFYTSDGKAVTGWQTLLLGRAFFKRHKDKEVKITYSPKRPHIINISSTKAWYFFGASFLLTGAAGMVWLVAWG
jgi:hypothetical protein